MFAHSLYDTNSDDGNTPLDDNEVDGLLPTHLVTRAELNQWEVTNIERAYEWIAGRTQGVLSVKYLQELHRRMFDETWEWAGAFRKSDKSISPYHWTEVPRLLQDLVDNTRMRFDVGATDPQHRDDLAMRFHHELVRIHPWPNGNGRHSRLATDLLLQHWERPPFSWGRTSLLTDAIDPRTRYISALQSADKGNFDLLVRFVRS